MRSFFKIFFASLLSIIVFCVLCVFILLAAVARITTKDKPSISSGSVLVIDLNQAFHERMRKNPLGPLPGDNDEAGLYDLVRMIDHAKTDPDISGILIEANQNANGFASSNEIRNALVNFRASKKF